MPDPLLCIDGLRVAFSAGSSQTEVVSDVSFTIDDGEVVALVGESGSGKSVTALSICRLLPAHTATIAGKITFKGDNVLAYSEKELQALRGRRIAYIFQEPGTALNPVFTAGYQIAESLRKHSMASQHEMERVNELLVSVGIRDAQRVARSYPHQLSGGQQQRVMIAMALACEPDLLIADEPTTALDVTVQAQILDLLKSLQQARRMSVLIITHNLAIAGSMAQRMVVMYAGQVIETGRTHDLLQSPTHPYTAALLRAVPRLRSTDTKLSGIPGTIPSAIDWPSGCRFHPRCEYARDACRTNAPTLKTSSAHRESRCPLWEEVL